MRTLLILLLQAFLFTSVVVSQVPTDNRPLDGFTAERAVAERRWEEQFRAVPAPASAREHLRRLTLEPHVARIFPSRLRPKQFICRSTVKSSALEPGL